MDLGSFITEPPSLPSSLSLSLSLSLCSADSHISCSWYFPPIGGGPRKKEERRRKLGLGIFDKKGISLKTVAFWKIVI